MPALGKLPRLAKGLSMIEILLGRRMGIKALSSFNYLDQEKEKPRGISAPVTE